MISPDERRHSVAAIIRTPFTSQWHETEAARNYVQTGQNGVPARPQEGRRLAYRTVRRRRRSPPMSFWKSEGANSTSAINGRWLGKERKITAGSRQRHRGQQTEVSHHPSLRNPTAASSRIHHPLHRATKSSGIKVADLVPPWRTTKSLEGQLRRCPARRRHGHRIAGRKIIYRRRQQPDVRPATWPGASATPAPTTRSRSMPRRHPWRR